MTTRSVTLLALLSLAAVCPLPACAQSAYLDEGARALVAGARARRHTVDRSILEYSTISSERISAGYRIIGRDRLLFRRETAAKIHWMRNGPIDIEVLGAREVVPVAIPKVQVPGDLKNYMPHIAFDPMDSEFLLRLDTTSVMHPLGKDGEANYRFRSGDSTVIRLQDGRSVRLRELEFIPRGRDPSLIAGSFWLDMDTYAVVQAVFKLARPFDWSRDAEKDEDKPPMFMPSISGDLTYVAVDYGLYDFRWWLPRYMVAEGVLRVGNYGSMPMKYERTYEDYDVVGDTLVSRVAAIDTAETRVCRPPFELSVSMSSGGDDTPPDSAKVRERAAARAAERAKRDSLAVADSIRTKRTPCVSREYRITRAADSMLVKSEHLPESIYAGESLVSEAELNEISKRISDLPDAPWRLGIPRLSFGLSGPGLVRYNRVEGLSVGARAQMEMGPFAAFSELRYGIADERLVAELALQHEATTRAYRIGAYQRLNATEASLRPFSLFSSAGSLLFGADETPFFRSRGGELIVTPGATRSQWYALRLYGELQSYAKKNTDFSLRHLIDKDYHFDENILADRATQYGADLTLRRNMGLNPAGLRGGIEIGARGETGMFEFVKPAATIRVTAPIFGFTFGGEAAAGSSAGDVPTQSLWYLGGTNTLRGYSIGVLSGDAFWRGRAELATNLPIVRLAVFSDVGWAGTRDDFSSGKPLLSAGIGGSLLDGIIRLDLARALRSAPDGSKGWRLHMYMGGIL